MAVTYPLLNGLRFDYSSIKLQIGPKTFPGFKSLNYKHSLSPGFVRGTAAQVLGRTRGQYDAEGDIEIYREDADDFCGLIQATNPALGILEVSFDINVTFFELVQGTAPAVQNDLLLSCRLKEEGSSNASGSDPSSIKYSFHTMMLIRNGRFPIGLSPSLLTRT